MTPTEKIKELEKGCGKNYYGIGICPERCGDFGTEKILLCEECQAKLSVYKEWEAEDKRRIEELKRNISIQPEINSYVNLNILNQIIDKIFSPQEDGK